MSNTVSGRFLHLDNCPASPGQCGVCGKPECEGGFLSPQMDFELYGSLYFCLECTAEMARVFDWITPDEANKLKQDLADAETELIHLREFKQRMEPVLALVTSNSQPYITSVTPSDLVQHSSNFSKSDQGTTQGESDDAESDTESGSTGVQRPTDVDDLINSYI